MKLDLRSQQPLLHVCFLSEREWTNVGGSPTLPLTYLNSYAHANHFPLLGIAARECQERQERQEELKS